MIRLKMYSFFEHMCYTIVNIAILLLLEIIFFFNKEKLEKSEVNSPQNTTASAANAGWHSVHPSVFSEALLGQSAI